MAHNTVRTLFGWAPKQNVVLRETSWLDGLRGTAALLVMINHFSTQWTSHFFSAPFGSEVLQNINPDKGIYYRPKGQALWGFWRLPILRLVSSAPAHVTLFYVISGFVLAWSHTALIHNQEYDKLFQALGSSVVRRWFRLYMAGALVGIVYLIFKIYTDDFFHQGSAALVWEFIVKTEVWANPFDTTHITPFSTSHDFNWVMWTLPFEFSGSIFVFVTLLALGRIRDFPRRFCAVVFVALYAMMKLRWDCWLFGSGLALADYVRHSGGFHKLTQSSKDHAHLWYAALVFGMLLMGWVGPMPWYSNLGYEWSASLPMPVGTREKLGEGILIWGFGSILVVASACHLSAVRSIFEHAIIQYLGRVSFMLYLIHMLINNNIALPLRTMIYRSFCTIRLDPSYDPPELYVASPLFHIAVFILLWITCLPLVLVLANQLEIHIDRRCLAFGRWVDAWLLDEPQSHGCTADKGTHRQEFLDTQQEAGLCRSSSGVDIREKLPGRPTG